MTQWPCDMTRTVCLSFVEGHGRVLALQKLKRKTCPVICLDDLSDAQRRAYTLVHNQLTLNSGFDVDMLNSELAQIKTDLPSLDMGQFDLRINDDTPDNVIIVPIFHDPGSTIIVLKIITHRRLYLRRVCLSDVVYYFLARKEIEPSIYIYNLIPV